MSKIFYSVDDGWNHERPISMCWISAAIAPRESHLETRLGEWYWDELPKRVPWWSIAWLEPDFGETWIEDDNLTDLEDLQRADFHAAPERVEAVPGRGE